VSAPVGDIGIFTVSKPLDFLDEPETLLLAGRKAHGEPASENPYDEIFEPPGMVDIGDHLPADRAYDGRRERDRTSRDMDYTTRRVTGGFRGAPCGPPFEKHCGNRGRRIGDGSVERSAAAFLDHGEAGTAT
jgi:hypothetical protein